jgi:hypothetical protein
VESPPTTWKKSIFHLQRSIRLQHWLKRHNTGSSNYNIDVDDGAELLTVALNAIRGNDGVGVIEMLKEGKGSDICKAKVAIVEGSKVPGLNGGNNLLSEFL